MSLRRSIWLTVGGVAAVCVLALGASDGWQALLQLDEQLDSLEAPANPPPPRPIVELLLAEAVSTEEMAIVAQFFGAPEYWVLPAGLTIAAAAPDTVSVVGVGQLADGTDLFFGDAVEVGASVAWGLLHNTGSQPLLVALAGAPDAEPVQIAPGGMVAVGYFINDFQAMAAGRSCTVRCGSGFYACCNCFDGEAFCKCVADGTITGCQSGGPGATGCGITCEPDPGPE